MLLPNPQSLPRVTLLAGPDRALRALVLEKLIAEVRPHHLTVLSFDHQRRPLVADPHLHFRWAEAKQIHLAQPGQIVPFRADLFIELNAMARGKANDGRGLIRARGEIRLASQPGTYRIWSQAGRVGVLGSSSSSANGKWHQDLTLVGPIEACIDAGHNFERSLLSDEEIELGPRLWRSFVDPFKEE